MCEILNEFDKLCLDELSEEWVQSIYYSEFLEFGELPESYECLFDTINIRSVFRNTLKVIKEWLESEYEEDENRNWTSLSNKFKHKSLLALLAFYIDVGNKNTLIKEHRNMSLLASRIYYKLLSIPGYKAYDIYHSQLFANSLLCLTYPKHMCDNEENYFNVKELGKETNLVVEQLEEIVTDLNNIITNLQLSPTDMNFEDILGSLVEVAGGAIINKLNVDRVKLTKVTQAIYKLINILVCEGNGNPNPIAIQILFKSMLPKLIAVSVDSRNNSNIVRSSYVSYSSSLLREYGKAALQGYTVLVQHVCYTLDGLERVEVRNARVALVTSLLELLSRRYYRDTVRWLLKLSTTVKVSHRQVAMELLAKLVAIDTDQNNLNLTEEDVPTQPNEERAADVQEDSNVNIEDESGIGADDADNESGQEQPPIDENTTTEETAAVPTRDYTVSHAELLRAIYERLHDASGTLRARALAILTDCLDSRQPHTRQALEELEGSGEVSRLVAAAARCVCDERAVVRRSAATFLQRLLVNGSHAPTSRDYAMLVGLCRDASIIVRVAAITALGELLSRNATDVLIDAFLNGPMHQLSDPEVKVQEQVINLVQQMLLVRLKKYEPNEFEDPLPWSFLAGIVRHNMRRHLQKACTMLVQSSNYINQQLVEVVSSHLMIAGEERDLQCLVLLTSVARHVQCTDLDFLLDLYSRLDDDEQECDGRLAALVLELLGTWAPLAPTHLRHQLRDRLLRRLNTALNDGCRPARASLAALLDEDDVNWATELMQISERRALGGGELEEWIRAADLSLVASAPPDPALLRLFLAALAQPPPEWCEERRAICVAGAGRLCVRSRSAAAALAPPLAQLLCDAAAPLAARHNALLALADVATRYSCIVEPLLPAVCGCLEADAAPTLRRAAARALTRLLLAGFLRLRTPLYYRFCALLADEDHDVREPAEYYVTCCLTVDAIYHHFVDCIIHYNKQNTECLSYDARQLIYDVMLQRLSLVQRLNVQCRLARDLLAHAADLDGDPPTDLHAALLDAIALLCGPRMRLPKKPEKSNDAADIDDLQERITTNIVSHKMKRTVAEVLVPAVLRLYARMRPRGGQLVTYLVRIATDLLNDYRHEIEELIENDEELVERVHQFQENIGLEPSFGNARNLVTASAPPEPDTPRSARKRPARAAHTHSPRKRTLHYTH